MDEEQRARIAAQEQQTVALGNALIDWLFETQKVSSHAVAMAALLSVARSVATVHPCCHDAFCESLDKVKAGIREAQQACLIAGHAIDKARHPGHH